MQSDTVFKYHKTTSIGISEPVARPCLARNIYGCHSWSFLLSYLGTAVWLLNYLEDAGLLLVSSGHGHDLKVTFLFGRTTVTELLTTFRLQLESAKYVCPSRWIVMSSYFRFAHRCEYSLEG